jgi:general secretion pathway protein C
VDRRGGSRIVVRVYDKRMRALRKLADMIATYAARMSLPDSAAAPRRLLTKLAAPRVVTGVLLAALGTQLYIASRDLLLALAPSEPAGRVGRAELARPGIDVSRITAAHLFGLDPTPATARAGTALASVPLTLGGVVAMAGKPESGAAMLGPKEGATRFVLAGGEVVPGVTLQSVYPDHVVLSRAGALESLGFPRPQRASLVAATEPGNVSSAAPQDAGTGGGSPNEQIANKIASATSGLSQVLTARGLFEGGDGGYRGVIVQPGADAELFAHLGFHPGDMITHINGVALNDPAMLALLKSGATIRVGVRRPGGTEVISVDTSSLAGYSQN